ncbi:tetratricopeptide repeat protein [Candidatus Poribacteria bacterium]|nr:tetratricopeptide repeat protein [Candidatus Poribacteria bacterium]
MRHLRRHALLGVALLLLTAVLPSCARREAIERYNKAVQLIEARRTVEAKTELEAAVRLRPKFPEAHNALGTLLNADGDYQQAIEHFQQAASFPRFKQRSLALRNLGVAYLNAERLTDALEAIQESVELEPTSADAHYALARVYTAMKRLPDAIDSLTQVLALDSARVYAIDRDPAFDELREDPRFGTLIATHWK